MVGAKQFAIMRKIIEDKKENPIVKNIAMPPWLKGEKELQSLSGSFLDRFKPISEEIKESEKIVESPKKDIVKKEITPKKEEFSEEVINKLTYKIFQNIKNYLDKVPDSANTTPAVNSKHIKLEITL